MAALLAVDSAGVGPTLGTAAVAALSVRYRPLSPRRLSDMPAVSELQRWCGDGDRGPGAAGARGGDGPGPGRFEQAAAAAHRPRRPSRPSGRCRAAGGP